MIIMVYRCYVGLLYTKLRSIAKTNCFHNDLVDLGICGEDGSSHCIKYSQPRWCVLGLVSHSSCANENSKDDIVILVSTK